jgi:hypothetical protein
MGFSGGKPSDNIKYASPPLSDLYVKSTHHCVACLPIIRPACLFLMTCTDPTSTINSGSSAYRRNYPRTQTKHSIHLSKIPNAGSSSTHVLTELVSDSAASIDESERPGHHGHTASVTLSSRPVTPGLAGVGGIMVKNETFVHKENSRAYR